MVLTSELLLKKKELKSAGATNLTCVLLRIHLEKSLKKNIQREKKKKKSPDEVIG